ncbi:unnamed protein product [Ciceribacter sp. T2.26MG-112.2]|uniref:hypothetical protein n=1 Tax=Ciceribacter sp. T2.26MG-112.2 TaxID=3137154 RepID=UPI000E130B65|nr:hypothetical protein [Ciceribacter naphthalenivorans]SSC71789.1 unnamed protein product [Ciceribacter naphthalenivorans]
MKGLLGKIRISRKIVLAFGGVLVLCGATGAAAVFIGADKILGPSYSDRNGLECTEVQTVTIKKKDRFWVRKYITTDKPGDGMTRVRTALRVAGAVYASQKPDLVQVVVLDKSGPTDRSAMRGRAVGADVIYIADPSRVPEEANGQVFTARYVDKLANADGLFYGEKIALPEAEIERLVARLDDKTDCIKPEVVVPEGQGAPAEHGAPAKQGAPAGHGEAAPAEGHGEAAPAEGHGAEAPAAEPADGHGAATVEADAHGADAGHAAEAAPAHEIPAGEGAQDEAVAPPAAEADAHAKATEPAAAPAESGGWFSSLKGMVLGSDQEAPAPAATEDAAAGHDAEPAETVAPEEAAAPAEHDAAPAEDAAAAGHEAQPEPAAEGKAKSAGAAWLEKLRSQPLEGTSAAPAESGIPAEDSDILPPKASAKADAEKHAEASD